MAITIKNGAKVLYQWERGVALTVTAPCDVLRVSREEEQRSVDLFPTWSGNTGTVLIPDRMLTESGYLRAARIDKGDGEERVMERVRIIIRAAQKPENDASSQREIRDWEELRIRMAALERAAREGKFDGEDGTTPHIGENGNWYIGDTDTGVNAKGDDGLTPHIGENGNWYIGGVDTGVKAKGDDGIAPHIGENGNWFIGETDTGVKAKGDDGLTPHIGENGNWYIGGVDTGVKAMGDNGITPHIGENGNWYIGGVDTGVKARSENVSEYAQDLVTNGVYVADDPDAMLCKPVEGTEANNPIRFRAEPGVLYINGVRKKVGAAGVSMKSPEQERKRAFGYRLYEETGIIKQIMWDVEITTDADGNEIITAIGYDPDFISAVLPVREGGIYDILIYTVTVPAGATQATQDMIRDLRGDERYCGFVRSKLAEDGGASVDIDDTLTVPGAAADAAVVGGKISELSETITEKVSKTGITLGLHSDGKYYIFVDGSPVGTGFELSGNSGDVFGYVDENNNIVLNGNLADGSYSIKYEMEDDAGNVKTIDIGNLVLDSNVYYTVTSNLTNCTNSNSATQAVGGQAYTATITADSGHELASVTVTMGGTDITSSAVSDGVINIASVTGNIVITASATETKVEITNWIEEVGYTENTRLSLSSGNTTTASGYECTGFIPAKHGDVIRIKNIDLTNENATNIVGYDSSKQPTDGKGTTLYNAFITNGTEENGVYTTTLSNTIGNAFSIGTGLTYIRIGSKSITADSIVTVNQEIV